MECTSTCYVLWYIDPILRLGYGEGLLADWVQVLGDQNLT